MKANCFSILVIIGLLISHPAISQIKIHTDNHISLGSLTKSFGVQIQPNGYTYFAPSVYTPYAWNNLTYSKNSLAKNYIVDYNGYHKFFVYGTGQIFSQGNWVEADSTSCTNVTSISDAISKVQQLRGVFYQPIIEEIKDTVTYVDEDGTVIKTISPCNLPDSNNVYIDQKYREALIAEMDRKFVGVVAQEVERVLPELVRTMPDGTKTVSYESMIGVLIEAIKQQQRDINSLKDLVDQVIMNNNPAKLDEKLGSENSTFIKGNNLGIRLYQNSPNPFYESTTIMWTTENSYISATIMIFDMEGNLIKSFPNLKTTQRQVVISGKDLNPGMYFYSLIVDGKEIDTKRMIMTQ